MKFLNEYFKYIFPQAGLPLAFIILLSQQGIFSKAHALPNLLNVAPEPLGNEPTAAQLLILSGYVKILQLKQYQLLKYFSFAGHQISIDAILSYINNNNIDLKGLTAKILFQIIVVLVKGNTPTQAPPAKDIDKLSAILQIIKLFFCRQNSPTVRPVWKRKGTTRLLGHSLSNHTRSLRRPDRP